MIVGDETKRVVNDPSASRHEAGLLLLPGFLETIYPWLRITVYGTLLSSLDQRAQPGLLFYHANHFGCGDFAS